MKKLKSIYLLLLSVLVIGAFASCAGSTDDDDGKPDAFKGEAYFTEQVAVAGDTKATSRAAGPQGGDDGDGRETAFENEYKVKNVCVFLYLLSRYPEASPLLRRHTYIPNHPDSSRSFHVRDDHE